MRRASLFALLFVFVGGAYWYSGHSRADLNDTVYRTTKVDRGTIVAAVSATGTINPITTVLVGSQSSGLVTNIYADFNTQVKAGDVVARLDSTQVTARLDAARADLKQAQAQKQVQQSQLQKNLADTERARAQLVDAQAQLARNETLVTDAEQTYARQNDLIHKGAATVVTLQAAKTQLETAKAQRDSAAAQINSATAAIVSLQADSQVTQSQIAAADAQVAQKQAVTRQVEVDLSNTEIRSPVDGVVVQRQVDLGQSVAASLQTPTLFQIAQDLHEMEIYANVDESDVGRVKPGQTVNFSVNAYPGRTFEGTVKLIRLGSQTVQNVVIYTTIVSVKNPQLELLPGMTANLRILIDVRDNVLRAPNTALRWRPPTATAERSVSVQQFGGLLSPVASFGPAQGTQGNGAQQRAAAEFIEAIKLEVKPSAGQEKAIDAVAAAARTQFQDAGRDETDQNTRRLRMRAARDQMAREIAAVLTPEQLAVFEALRERFAANGQTGANAGNGGPGQPARIFTVGHDGKPVPVAIRIGASDGVFTEMLSGALSEGQSVITGGGVRQPGGGLRLPPGAGP